MINNTTLNTAALGLPVHGGSSSVENSPVRSYFEQVLARVQAQPLRVLPQQTRSSSGSASLAQQMQREGII